MSDTGPVVVERTYRIAFFDLAEARFWTLVLGLSGVGTLLLALWLWKLLRAA